VSVNTINFHVRNIYENSRFTHGPKQLRRLYWTGLSDSRLQPQSQISQSTLLLVYAVTEATTWRIFGAWSAKLQSAARKS
jgi:hypothetical protein